MENGFSNVSAIKQPSPNVLGAGANSVPQKETEPKKEIKRPHVGVLNPPVLSPTPLSDVLEKRKIENPRMKYKLTIKKPKILTFQTMLSLGIIACGAILMLPQLKNLKGIFKFVGKYMPDFKNLLKKQK